MEGRRKEKSSEDFEKPPKTGEYNPQVCKGWNEKMGKSKFSSKNQDDDAGYIISTVTTSLRAIISSVSTDLIYA